MKRVKFIFIFGIIIGLLFMGVNVFKGNPSSIDKKEVNLPNITDDFYASFDDTIYFYNTDQDYKPIKDSLFSLTTWDGKKKYNSTLAPVSTDIGLGSRRYCIDVDINMTFEESYNLLSQSQKDIIENIQTISDIKEHFGSNTSPYRTYGGGPIYFSGYLGTYYVLDQTQVKDGYLKQKYIVPGYVSFDYKVVGTSQSTNISTLPNNSQVILTGIRYYFEKHDSYATLLSYDNYDDIFTKKLNEIHDYIANNIEAAPERFCFFPAQRVDDNKYTEASKIQGGYQVCPAIVVNQKGEVDFSINTTVNEKESINTTSNSKLKYQVNVKNNGFASYDNKIISTLPEGFVYVEGSASNDGVYNSTNNTITWNVYKIAAGEEITLSYEAYAPNGLNILKSYIGEASIESSASQKVISNKTTVRLMANPKTNAPLYGIGITLLITWGVAGYLYLYTKKQKKLIEN